MLIKPWQFKKGQKPAPHKEGCKCFRCGGLSFDRTGIKQSPETIAKRVAKLKGHRPFVLANPNAKEIRRVKELFYMKRRRARLLNAEGTHTYAEWEQLKKIYEYMCLCCKKVEPEISLSQDHIIPLSKGGSDYIENIQPLCRNCNSQKLNKSTSYLPSNHSDLIYKEKGWVI